MKYLFMVVAFASVLGWHEATAYVVTPPVIEHDVEARSIIAEEIKVTNTTAVPLRLYPTVNTIRLGADGAIETFEAPVMTDQTINPASWVAVSRARLELAPGETKRVPVEITVNPNAVPGEYYVFVGFATGEKRDDAEAVVMSGQAPGTVLRLAMVDKTSEALRLQGFTIDRFVLNRDDATVVYELQNTGDTPVVPRGEIILYDVRGKEVGAMAVNAEGTTIAPGTTERFTATVPETAAYGRHKAFLNLEYGTTQRANVYDTTFFTVVPLRLLLATFVLLIVLSVLLTLLYLRKQRTPYHVEDDAVALYVRDGIHSDLKDHDIILKKD